MRSILGIDTASPHGSVALVLDGTSRGSAALLPGEHSSGLAISAARLVESAGNGLTLASLSGIAVSQGPGSFTGLRIGLAFAKGLAVGAGIPLVLVSAHEAAAHAAAQGAATSAPDSTRGALLVTVTPGERRQVELALWEAPAGADSRTRPKSLAQPESIPEEDCAERILALVAGRGTAGGGPFLAIPANDAIAALLDEDEIPCGPVRPLATSVAILGDLLLQSGLADDVVLASPAYGRAPNARKPPA